MIVSFVRMVFFVVDGFGLFYVCFEFSVFPTLILIMKWGYQPERLQARYYFVIYTVCASLPLLFIILYYINIVGSSYYGFLRVYKFMTCSISPLVYLSLTVAFLVKAPMWTVHLWLPKAHVEAPVRGSMVLAGILLKLGGFGLMKTYLVFGPFCGRMNSLVVGIRR